MRVFAVALILCVAGAAAGEVATKPAAPASQPATRKAAPRTWAWTNQTLSSDEKIATLKESLVGLTIDQMYSALQAANFAPPNVKSADTAGTVYEAGGIVDAKAVFMSVVLRITTSEGKVQAFTEKRQPMY